MSTGAVGQSASQLRTHGEVSGAGAQAYGQQGDGVSSWQDDGLFGVFVSLYAEARQMSAAALRGMSGEIGATGDGMHLAHGNVRDTEIANAENFDQTWV